MGRSILPDSPSQSSGDSDGFFPSINSYDGKVMLAAIISLLVVISFVFLLHVYARWLLGQAQQRRRLSVSSSSYVFDPTTLHHHIRTTIYDDTYADSPMNGLDDSTIASLPLFVYKSDLCKNGLDCVICLSVFEDDEMGRNLPKCKHAFHVQCIDMWLQSHSGCPICRAPVGPDKSTAVDSMSINVSPENRHRTPEVVSGELVDMDANSPSEVSIQTPPNLNLERNVLKDSSSQPPLLPPPSPPQPPVARPLSSLSSSSLLPSPSTSLGCSLKRMLSRSRSEHKVFPSSVMINELNV